MTYSGHVEHFVTAPAVPPRLFSASGQQQPSEEMSACILVVSGDRAMRNFLRREFLVQKLRVDVCTSAAEALAILSTQGFDLMLVDLNATDESAYACLAEMRSSEAAQIPILTLATRTGADDTVLALDSGADDCLIKPFSLQEMLARVRSLLRRRISAATPAPSHAGLILRPDQNVVLRGNRRIQLTAREYGILEYMMANYGKTVSRIDLLRDVWQTSDDPRTNLVDVYMKYLRDKLDAGAESKLIRTVRGAGYVLSAE